MARLTFLPILVMLLATPSAAEDPVELAVIVHPSRPVTVDVNDLRRIYLKQRHFWPDGNPIVPINREDGPLRRVIDQIVGGSEPARLAAYWDRRYFEGIFPPITLASDEAIRRYVASKPNAVGYVDARVVDESVRVALRLPVRPVASPDIERSPGPGT